MPPEVKHYYNSDKCWLDDLTLYSGLQNVNVNQYILSANATFLDYEFASEGVKGKITKRIQFRKVNDNPSVYNLSLGDFEPTTGTVSDITTTNNKDTDMVLRTVAAAVILFSHHYPDAFVMAEGSTPSRARLYRMRVSANLSEITKQFSVYGLLQGKWEPFSKNKPYSVLLAKPL